LLPFSCFLVPWHGFFSRCPPSPWQPAAGLCVTPLPHLTPTRAIGVPYVRRQIGPHCAPSTLFVSFPLFRMHVAHFCSSFLSFVLSCLAPLRFSHDSTGFSPSSTHSSLDFLIAENWPADPRDWGLASEDIPTPHSAWDPFPGPPAWGLSFLVPMFRSVCGLCPCLSHRSRPFVGSLFSFGARPEAPSARRTPKLSLIEYLFPLR